MYQSPLHYCQSCNIWVALDQSVEQCRRLNSCPGPCPYQELFAAVAEERKRLIAIVEKRLKAERCTA